MKCIRFDLRVWFTVTGFAVIAVLGAAFAALMNNYLTTTVLDREVAVTQEFLQAILGSDGYGEGVFVRDGDGANGTLKSFAEHMSAMPEILRVNVYGTDKRILWSSDEVLTGRLFERNPELDEAMEGNPVSEIGWLEGDSKPEEHISLDAGATGHFIETYLPIRRDDTILGVVEVYKLPTALEMAIDRGRRIIEVSVAIGSLVLFATLYWIVRRGAIQIQRQQVDLGRMEGLAVVGQMASAVAHSLRNPLSGIRSSAELLRLESPTITPVCDEIIGEVDRLNQCVRELMNYARSETVSVQRVEPLDLVRDTVERQRAALDRARIAVTIEDERRTRHPVDVDTPMLGQAMTSIVTNAIEALPEGGHLNIILSEPDSRHTLISFTDNGSGIPANLLPPISEPLFTMKIHRLRLGLALARHIVERFNGTLDILSSDQGGAMVRIKLVVAR